MLTPGVADGAGVPFASILALNVRTEVAYGLYSDGCTALSVHSADVSILAQNWDWKFGQAPNLINLVIEGTGVISIITEGGIIGKIGVCSAGVGVCLNAIAALGVAHDRLPVHLALRAALDWAIESPGEGVARRVAERIRDVGVAAAGHILLADAEEAFGLEVSYLDIVDVPKTSGRGATAVLHSNHYVVDHPGVKLGSNAMVCSPDRLARIGELFNSGEGGVTAQNVSAWLQDVDRYPASICRDRSSKGGSETLFSIVMDLREASARVKVGKPDGNGETLTLVTR